MPSSGAVDDAAFAEARARRLLRSGRSARAMSAHLMAKGVDVGLLERVRPGPEEELLAALAFARRRRLGPFRTGPGGAETERRELGGLGARRVSPRDSGAGARDVGGRGRAVAGGAAAGLMSRNRPRFSRAATLRGAQASLPLLVGLVPFALVVGILAQGQGLSLLEATLMSALCYAGSAQLLALGHWAVPAPVVGAAVAAFIVNLRLALMGPVMALGSTGSAAGDYGRACS